MEEQRTLRRGVATSALFVTVAMCSGCHIATKSGGGKDDVSFDTPLGGMHIKTDPVRVLQKIGLPRYPGSVMLEKKDRHDGSNDGSADVDMSFGSFHLGVLAAGFQTPDSQKAVEAYYRTALAQYSDVIACRHHEPIGTPTKTGLGLTCEDDNNSHHGHHGGGGDADELQLKAGSGARQHIVAIKPQDGGTRIELISLDLPKGDKD